MNYHEADQRLIGRCGRSKKLENNTYLERQYPEKAIAIRLHATNVVTLFENGDIRLATGGWDTPTTRDRMNTYLPKPWAVGSHRGHTLLYKVGSGYHWTPIRVIDRTITIKADGTVQGGSDPEQLFEQIRQSDREAARPRNRARYWLRKVRNGAKPSKQLTVEKVLAEENVSVRVAMMNIYGMDRFFLDANAKVVDQREGYQLLELPLNEWLSIKALEMSCTTTGAVYLNQVPPTIKDVPSGLNWMFDVPEGQDYLSQVTQQA